MSWATETGLVLRANTGLACRGIPRRGGAVQPWAPYAHSTFILMAKKPVKPKKTAPDPDKKARVHKELEGFEIGVNPLGEITSNYSIEQINQFLGRHVRDKKLVDRAGQFGEKVEDDEDIAPEPEETDEDFMRRTSREAKRKKTTGDAAAEAAETRGELPTEE